MLRTDGSHPTQLAQPVSVTSTNSPNTSHLRFADDPVAGSLPATPQPPSPPEGQEQPSHEIAPVAIVPWILPAFVTGGILSLAVGAMTLGVLQNSSQRKTQAQKIQTTSLTLSRLEETMAASVRLAAMTNDDRWYTRYENAYSQMSDTLKTLEKVNIQSATLHQQVNRLRNVTEARLKWDKRTLTLLKNQKRAGLRTTFSGNEYDAQRVAFAGVQTQVAAAARNEIQNASDLEHRGGIAFGLTTLLSCGLLVLAGNGFQKTRRHWGRTFTQQQMELKRIQDDKEQVQRQSDSIARELKRLEELRRFQDAQLRRNTDIDHQLRLLEQAIEAADDVVMIAVADTSMPRVVRVNKAFERMTGYSPEEILGRSPKMLQGKDTDRAEIARIRAKLQVHEPIQAELLNYRKDGTSFWVQLNIQPVFDERGYLKYWISIQRDITERKRVESAILWQANHDILTKLPNRNFYQSRLGSAIMHAEEQGHLVGVLFIDLDDFKKVNDSLGHSIGDVLLKQVSDRLKARLRSNELLARFGGDEFTVLLPNITSPIEAATVAQKLIDALDQEHFVVDGHELTITASVGISIAPDDGKDIDTLLKNADTAMYRAKEQRDSFRVYNVAMNARALDRLQIEAQLRRALEREEFYLQYQPQVDLKTGRMFGVEALLRWENPVLGRVSPAEFIPIAEEKGWIEDIGEWVLNEACCQAAQWQEQDYEIRMSINLSARQFGRRDLTDQVRQALLQSSLSPDLLDLELTETILAGPETEKTLHLLKGLGVRLSVDDFGVGYSSYAYLRKLPLDVLKIDKIFVQGLGEDHKSDVMVRVLIEMAHEMPFEVIAEGVETERQKTMLMDMGCDGMQGYLFSPPVNPDKILALTQPGLARFHFSGSPATANSKKRKKTIPS